MASITRENIGLLNDKLIVSVSKEDYFPNFEKTLKTYSKNANLPGFRKGMVPTGLVKKMYGQSVFTEEVLKTVEKGLFDYLENEKLDIFAQPIASEENEVKNLDHNNPGEYRFSFEIGLKPVIQIADLTKASLTQYKVIVTDEMVQNELERLQQKLGKMLDEEVVSVDDNILNVSFKAMNDDGSLNETIEPKTNSLLVKYFRETYRKKLIGLKKDDTIDVVLSEAFEDKELEFILQDLQLTPEQKAAHYQITISKIGRIENRILDETFFKEAFPNKEITTEEAAKEELKKDIQTYWDTQTKNQLQDSIYHYLVDHTPIDFPESFLKKWMQTGREKPSTADEVEAEYPQFSKSLKWTLISDALSKQNDLKVNQDEIKNFAKMQLMGYMGVASLDENNSWIESYADKMLQDKKFVEDTYHRVITEKLFDWAATQVTTNEKPISVDDFTQLVKEHKH